MNDKLFSQIESAVGAKIRYKNAVINKSARKICVNFISDVAVSQDIVDSVQIIIKNSLPASFSAVDVKFEKVVVLEEFVKKAVVKFFDENHKIACFGVTEGDVCAQKTAGGEVKVMLRLEKTVYDFFNSKDVAAELKAYLEKSFVDDFAVTSELKEGALVEPVSLDAPSEPAPVFNERRTLRVDAVTRLFDDDETDEATYIADTTDLFGEVYLAGVVTSIREQISKNDKPYFIIEFTDKTGTASGAIFPNKDKIQKVRKLGDGSEIIIRGEYTMRGEYKNLRILSINYCAFPKNFIPKERRKMPVPAEYYLVKPQPLVIETQDNFLEEKPIPQAFIGRRFVVFDLETTGTDFDDKITEIGAVKIEDGKITEYFSTLVNPQKHIPAEVVDLTGIDDAMVANAPTFEAVCPDFYKFCYGSTLVAHNMEFDSRFIKNQSKPLNYLFDNPLMDTLAIARGCIVGVANYKLNTLCDKFGIVFRHHRAYSDALATAQLLIELIRIRKKFPDED